MIIKSPRAPKGKRSLSAIDFPQPEGRGSNGRRFCRVCHGEVGLRRRTICDDECEKMLYELIDPARVVEREEAGVCQICGWDLLKLTRIIHLASKHYWDIHGRKFSWYGCVGDILRPMGLNGADVYRTTLYDFDHITPISEGGRHERANLRTICLPCHKGETAALRRRLVLDK